MNTEIDYRYDFIKTFPEWLFKAVEDAKRKLDSEQKLDPCSVPSEFENLILSLSEELAIWNPDED
jgi:hypothetical protein